MDVSEITLLELSQTSIVKDGLMFWYGPSKELQLHDFFEISLVTEGYADSIINEEEKLLEPGSLIIIRPYDIHLKQGKYIANFGVSVKTFNSLFDYIGDSLDRGKIFRTKETPTIILSQEDRLYFKERIDNAYARFNNEKDGFATLESRHILMGLMLRFAPFLQTDYHCQTPTWLEDVLEKMKEPRYFTEGLPALMRLAGRSQPYLCRVFKKYYNLTPTQYINDLRLKYAVYLLDNEGLDILQISNDAGFDSLSHFYHCFKKFFRVSPKRYRKLKVNDID